MNKKRNIFYSILIFLFAFSFNSGVVNAYFTHQPDEKVNTFTIAEMKELTYEYYYLDENDNEVQAQNSISKNIYTGTQVNINDTLTNLDCSSIKHYVNGSLYNGSTYTISDNDTIKEVCELNRYTITYNLDGGTLNNPKTTYTNMTETFSLETPTKNGATFIGWTGNNGTTPQTSVTITKGSTGNKTYTANWQNISYTVTHNSGNFTYTGESTVNEGETYTAKIRTQSYNNQVGTSSTITMGGRTLDTSEYSLDETDSEAGNFLGLGGYREYTLSIPNVTGNIVVNIQIDTCLVEGTKVMLWDGSYKNIEDVTYNDLLKVWNHDTGTYGYEYAAWIEQAGTANSYIKVKFSDGNELKVVGNHSIFSKTANRYVNINSNELKIGDEVVNLKNGISYVTVTNIEVVEEEVRYYHVISSRYFNLITNDLLTTYEIYNNISNFMGFDGNLKWKIADVVREDLYTYEDFSYLDHYLYKTFRLEELKYLVKNSMITQEEMDDLFNNYLLNNEKKVIPPKDKNGNYLWMVTTSDMNNPNNKSHQMVEGSTYEVPEPKKENGFKYWYNHSDNKYYNPGDKLLVESSMYLEAIYGEVTADKIKEPELVEESKEEGPEKVEEPTEEISTEIVDEEVITDSEDE